MSLRFAAAIIVAFLPAAVIGVAAHKYIKAVLVSPKVVAVALIVGGIAILIIERFAQRPRIEVARRDRPQDGAARSGSASAWP